LTRAIGISLSIPPVADLEVERPNESPETSAKILWVLERIDRSIGALENRLRRLEVRGFPTTKAHRCREESGISDYIGEHRGFILIYFEYVDWCPCNDYQMFEGFR